ncbi:MAG: NAD(P)(+) transhydrogenase (Re/Si-specific) subunit beta [Bacteroidia bacterium]|nr:NAD(P)(+) transhydrogenase (Re/Si-specific) subunit beta [Bacteroidia bacterium]MDW8133616.1 NAD(P)(+) transhydrogenase (Re/Si-specific) subunit beta [Bacteroidia bacterium]
MESLIQVAYLFASIAFIIAIKLLNSPSTARLGNLIGALGMLGGIVATLFYKSIIRYEWILIGLVLGSLVGAWLALKVKMTAMPQMVALLNGFGGAASALVASAEAAKELLTNTLSFLSAFSLTTIGLSIVIGSVTFTGSLIAFAKLQELISGRPFLLPAHHYQSLLLFLLSLGATAYFSLTKGEIAGMYVLSIASFLLGFWITLPIGGADMPVIVAFLNSLSGLAAAATGFVLNNYLLIIAGTLVGASGLILTQIMSRAMNRSLWNVLFGAVGAEVSSGGSGDRTVRSTTAEDVALMLSYAKEVVIVPGYGMAVAQAQHAVKKLVDALSEKGVETRFAIHPVAGRMPGHMNVLLAEADIPYEKLYEMERINPDFPQVDVALVIGANDVVNPAARKDQNSPLYGMPILDVDKAKTVVVLKRSMNPGFAGVENELFYQPNTYMLFGDARKSLESLTQALKEV